MAGEVTISVMACSSIRLIVESLQQTALLILQPSQYSSTELHFNSVTSLLQCIRNINSLDMGCCHARDKHLDDGYRHSFKDSSPVCTDPQLAGLETYAMELLGTQEGWRVDFDQSPLLIRHLNVRNPTVGV